MTTEQSFLDFVQKGKTKKPRRVFLYASHGVGKTTWASKSEAPIFLQTEDGADDIGVDRLPIAESFTDVINHLRSMATTKHPYKTLVIDTVDWLERLIWEQVANEEGKSDIEDIGYKRGYIFAMKHWENFKKAMDYLRNKKGMTIVLLSHCEIIKYSPPLLEPYDIYSPKIHKRPLGLLTEWVDELFFANFITHIKTKKKGEKVIPVGNGERVIYTTEVPAYLAKNRLGITRNLKMEWSDYQAEINNAGKSSK